MKRKLRQLLSLTLAVLMLLSVAPLTAFASETYDLSIEDSIGIYDPDNMPYYERFSFFDVGAPEYDGCFGNQLSGETKRFYEEIVNYYVTEKNSGNYEYVPTKDLFCVLQYSKSQGDYINMDDLDLLHAAACSVVFDSCDAFLKDFPEVFWFRNSSFSSSYETVADETQLKDRNTDIVDVTVYIEKIVYKPVEIYKDSHNDTEAFDAAVDALVNSMEIYFESIGPEITRTDKLKYMHDYICDNSDYDYASLSDPSDLAAHSAQPFFIGDKLHVCEGYAKILKILCDRFEIPCVCVSGKTKDYTNPDDRTKDGSHMWNYVQMEDGKWYLIDITWDDQDSKIYDTYFLANWNTEAFYFGSIEDERYEIYTFSKYTTNGVSVNGKEFVYPTLSSEEYVQHTHSWIDSEIIKEATCTETGEKVVKCENDLCTNTKKATIELDTTSHSYTSEITTPATHLKEGVETFTCDCGDTYTKPLAKLSGHTYNSAITTPATHLKEGVETFSCDCGDSYTKSVAKLTGHTYDAVIIAPTCTAKGFTTYTCDCGESYTSDYVNKLPHAEEIIPATDSTCTAAGYTEGKKCTVCKAVTVEPVKKPLLSHRYTETAVKEATCTTDGYTEYTCADCSASYKDNNIKATGHDYENGICSICGDSRAKNCSHMCHKNNFIWKILRFFFKLFRIQPTCECGVKHY